jgi:6-phosphogluconolactonase
MTEQCNSRRNFLNKIGIGMLALSIPVSAFGSPSDSQKGKTYRMYIGTYTQGRREGIYLYELNADTGALKKVSAFPAEEASYLAIHPNKRYLYAVNELMKFDGKDSGAVSAFSIAPKTGELTFINQQPSHGGAPCYITTDKAGKNVLVANYMGGNVASFPVKADGQLEAATDIEQHEGAGPNKDRQEAVHAHCIIPDPNNRFAFAVDLGVDKIFIYKLDEQGKLVPNNPAYVETKPGAGPRHITFHPNGRYAYVVNELDSTMNAYAYDPQAGILKELQTVSMLPEGFTGKSQCADLEVSQDGRFLYGSNRGHNSITVFAIDKGTGKLTPVEHVSTQGNWPRNFTIVPGGKLMLVANERSNNIVAFKIDSRSGKLSPTGQVAEVPAPVCMLIV